MKRNELKDGNFKSNMQVPRMSGFQKKFRFKVFACMVTNCEGGNKTNKTFNFKEHPNMYILY